METGAKLAGELADEVDNKLNTKLVTLIDIAEQVRNQEPISARPECILEQAAENRRLIELVLEIHLYNAASFVSQVHDDAAIPSFCRCSCGYVILKSVFTAVRIGRISTFANLLTEIQTRTDQREQVLNETFDVAQRFVADHSACRDAFETLIQRLQSYEPIGINTVIIFDQQIELEVCHPFLMSLI